MTEPIPGSPRFVERLLAIRIGLDVASVGEGLIVRGVQNRMTQLGIRRPEDYQRILLGPSDEIQALIEEVVIPESWFFRDDRPFETFRDFIRSGWVDRPDRSPVSVLCLPCAAGEEPYSVAMALLDLGITRDRSEVVAVDISQHAIRRAAAGLYGPNAFRGMDLTLQARYFSPMQGRYLLSPEIRTAVRFEVGNILDPNLLSNHRPFDAVFCRNLLIYFDDEARERAFATLVRLVATDGLLFLGHADRPDPRGAACFVPAAGNGSFTYRKLDPTRPAEAPMIRPPESLGSRRSDPRTRALVSPPPAAPPVVPARTPVTVVHRPSPSSLEASPPSTDRAEAMRRASTLADQGRYVEATRIVHELVGASGLDAQAHFLLGIIRQAAGDRPAAEAELVKAIYLDPEHDEALLALALLARRRGDVAAEAVYRRRADRVLARKGRS